MASTSRDGVVTTRDAHGSAPVSWQHAWLRVQHMVGMEIHVDLAKQSKRFSIAPSAAHPDYYDASPNALCDPVVLGMPGVLPVLNVDAVDMAMRVGLALGCQIAHKTKWE